jgi:hypothetical protein
MKKHKADELKKIARRTNIRDYEYAVWVTKSTGRVVRLRGGCRRWSSFEHAKYWYASDGVTPIFRKPARWSDAWCGTAHDSLVERQEARAILARLESDVADYVRKLRAAKRRARK